MYHEHRSYKPLKQIFIILRLIRSAVIESSGQEEITLARPFILYHLPVRSDKQSYALVDLKALRFEKVCPGQLHMARVYRTVSYGPGGVPVSHRTGRAG